MAEFKISFHEDSKFNLDHDNRKHSSPNINPEKTPENISYAGNISLQKFYEETFQKAYEEKTRLNEELEMLANLES